MAKRTAIRPANFWDRKSFEAWRRKMPVETRMEISAVLASRSALRVLPLVGDITSGTFAMRKAAALTFSALRANFIARVAGTNPFSGISAAAHSAAAAAHYESDSYNSPYYNSSDGSAADSALYGSAGYAASAAAAAASVIIGDSDDSAADAANYAAYAANDEASSVWGSLRADARHIEGGGDPVELRGRPLWDDAPPGWWSEAKRRFGTLLVLLSNSTLREAEADNWLIWLEWFQSIANGQPSFNLPKHIAEEVDLRIALGDGRGDFWDREPHLINAEIAGWLIEVLKTQTPPEIDRLDFDEMALPPPFPAAPQFDQGSNGEIVIVRDPASPASGRTNQDLLELYQEAREKNLALKALGRNRLGAIETVVNACTDCFPENFGDVSVNRIWSKISTLRGILELHQREVSKPQDNRDTSVILDSVVASQLADTLKQSNLFLAFDARGRELDRLAHGPQLRRRDENALRTSQPVIVDIGRIADRTTVNIVIGDHNNVANASKTIHGDQAVERVVQQESNLLIRVFLVCLRIVKAIGPKGTSESVSQVLTAVGGKYGGAILEFVASHQDQLHKVADAFGMGPDVQRLIDIIAETAKLLS